MATSFTWNGATISANDDLTIADESRIAALAGKLPDDIEFVQRYRFAEFMIAAKIVGTSPLSMVGEHDEPEALEASFAEWRKLKRRFGTLWAVALNETEGAEKNG